MKKTLLIAALSTAVIFGAANADSITDTEVGAAAVETVNEAVAVVETASEGDNSTWGKVKSWTSTAWSETKEKSADVYNSASEVLKDAKGYVHEATAPEAED